jgi:hypothetical protein
MLGVFAEFETNLRRERQLEGIAKAEGRPPSIEASRVGDLKAQECDLRTSQRHWRSAERRFIGY